LLTSLRHIIVGAIDFFHRPVARWIPTQTFRYLACGGSNTVLNIALYHIFLNFVLRHQDFHIYGPIKITAIVAAWIIAQSISFPAGFIMSRHIVFPESNLHGRVQLFRYALITATFILLSYVLIRAFAVCMPGINETIRYVFVCLVTTVLSYISQRKFTFRIIEDDTIEDDVVPN
jgi:putative flippase GtrA